MKQYLKMADVFPVEIRTDDESGRLICDEDGVILESFSGDKVADYTLHAINSHDELVQMNQDLLAALKQVVGDVRALADHSYGVHGLHHNGDLAPWGSLFAGGFFGGRFFCGNNGFRLFGCYCFFSCSRFFYGLFSVNLLCSCFFVSVSRYFFCCRGLGFGFFTGAFGGCFCQQRIGHGFEFSFGCHLHSFLQYPPARQRCMGCT